ncbi:MAG TPA: EamA family transporter [Anaeromyxobacter sp.]
MTPGPIWLLASAVLHAGWNALLKREREPELAALGVLAGGLLFATAIAIAWPGAGFPTRAALLWGLGAGAFEAVYFVTLGSALARASYGAVYAIARGGALVVVWPVAVAFLREPVSATGAAGAALVGAGVILVAAAGKERASAGGIALAVACAGTIAGYHVCYDLALAAGAGTAPLFALAFAVALPPAWLWARLTGRTMVAVDRGAVLRWTAAGSLVAASFLLFLLGLARSGAGVALTLRNTSVVFAQVLALAIGERVPPRQLIGSVLVVLGAALVAAG